MIFAEKLNSNHMQEEYLFESITEYDIDEPKWYDMKFGGAKQMERIDTPNVDNIIELNGIKSELVISADKEGSLMR